MKKQVKDYSALAPRVRAELLIGHLQDVLAEAAAMLDSVKTRENHVILRDYGRVRERVAKNAAISICTTSTPPIFSSA
jgi:hypothetical protein